MTENEIMEKWLAENQEKPAQVTVEMLADIMLYKSKNIKAHIPAWVFKETFTALVGSYGKCVLTEKGIDIKF